MGFYLSAAPKNMSDSSLSPILDCLIVECADLMEETRSYLAHVRAADRLNATTYECVGWDMVEGSIISLLQAALASLFRQQAVLHGEISIKDMHEADGAMRSQVGFLREVEVPPHFLPRHLEHLWTRSGAFYDRVERLGRGH
jgi:hypothetical protein